MTTEDPFSPPPQPEAPSSTTSPINTSQAKTSDLQSLLSRIATVEDYECYCLVTDLVHMATNVKDFKSPSSRSVSTTSFLYDAGNLRGKCPISLIYVVKRLLRGTASTCHRTRVNYATALYAILTEHGNLLPAQNILEWSQICLSTQDLYGSNKVNSTAGNSIDTGKLIALKSLIHSHDITLCATQLLTEILKTWQKNENTCFLAQDLVAKVLDTLGADSGVTLPLVQTFTKAWDSSCLQHVALFLTISDAFERSKIKTQGYIPEVARIRDPISFMPLIQSVDPNHMDRPKYLAFFSALLSTLLRKPFIPRTFLLAWQAISDICFSRIRLALPILLHLVSLVINVHAIMDDECFQSVFSKNIVELMIYGSQELICEAVSFTVLCDKRLAKLISTLLSRGHKGVATSARILQELEPARLEKVLALSGEQCEDDALPQYLCGLYQRLAKRLKTKAAINGLLRAVLAEAMRSSGLSEGLQSCLQSVLHRAISLSPENPEFIIDSCLARFDELYSPETKEGKKRLRALDEPVRDSLKLATKLVRSMAKKALKSGLSEDSKTLLLACKSVTLAARLLLFIDPIVVADIFGELKDCVKKIGKAEDDAEMKGSGIVDTLLEILLQWLSRPSALLRALTSRIMDKLAPVLGKSSCDSLIRILTTKPGTVEQEELLEDDLFESASGSDFTSEPLGEVLSAKLLSPTLQGGIDTDPAILSDDIDLDEAGEEELTFLDAQLKGIMQARKAHHNEKGSSQRSLFHFKQRILDIIPVILTASTPSGSASFARRISIPLLQAMSLHSGKRPDNKSMVSENQDLLKRLLTSFDCALDLIPASSCSEFPPKYGKQLAEELLEFLKGSGPLEASVTSRACAFFVKITTCDSIEHHDAPTTLLEPIWTDFLKASQKTSAHSSSLLAFFEAFRLKSPRNFLALVASSAHEIIQARPFIRSKVLSLMDACWSKVAQEDNTIVTAVLMKLAYFYHDDLKSTDERVRQLSSGGFKEELSFVTVLVSKSRISPNDELLELWREILQSLDRSLTQCKWYKAEDSLTKSMRNRLKSTTALLLPAKAKS